MRMLPNHATSIRDKLGNASDCVGRCLWGVGAGVSLSDLLRGTTLGGRLPELSGRAVLIATQDQLAAGFAVVELAGGARRGVLCPPRLFAAHLPSVIAAARRDPTRAPHRVPARGV